MIKWIEDFVHFGKVKEEHKDFLVLMFYANFSHGAKRALSEIERFSKENKEVPIYIVDVEKIKGIHKQFEVENVPIVLLLRESKVIRRIKGVESAQFYARVILGIHPSKYKKEGQKVFHRVVVYSGPGCPACGAAKAYLRKRGINFRTVDISRDQRAAERLVKRSGQMAVPQIDIDGHLIVGFDKVKIDRFLSIK